MNSPEEVIEQTKRWIEKVVIGCNFCPFAAMPFFQQAINYVVKAGADNRSALEAMMIACRQLDDSPSIETSLVIFPDAFVDFDSYLDLVSLADKLLKKEGYEGVYQVASFHPQYRFADSYISDAANYTNRSPYPMLHLLREKSVEAALNRYPNPQQIPLRNVDFSRKKGTEFMKNLRDQCISGDFGENKP